jgi:hypothetical protein
MIAEVSLLSDLLAAFHSNPISNETLRLLTSPLSSHYIKMMKLFFLFGVHKPLPPYRYVYGFQVPSRDLIREKKQRLQHLHKRNYHCQQQKIQSLRNLV